MGVLSLSKTIPTILPDFSESLRGAFGPERTIQYAKGDKQALIRLIRRNIKVTMVIISVLAGGIIIMSDAFYSLWLPSQDARLLQILTILGILRYITDSGITTLANVFPTTNTVRYNAVGLLISGAVSITATLLLVKFTDWDLYVIAGTSSVVTIIRSLIFLIPVTSRFLGLKWNTFYPQVLQSLLSCAVVVAVGFVIRRFVAVDSWIMFFLV
jgi:O-antigen/teichoic acid export membrane protein